MSGILNKKQRLIDLVVTSEGRKKIAKGRFRPTFASFSDKDIDYNVKDISAKAFSENTYISVETPSNSFIDRIIFENDDSGRLFINESTFSSGSSVIGNTIFTRDPDDLNLTGSEYRKSLTSILTGSVFDRAANQIILSSFDNFKNNHMIGTNDAFDNVNEFKMSLSNNKDYFVITNSSPFKTSPFGKTISIESADPLMFDSKLGHLRNFAYLPPENTDGSSYGTYQDLRNTSKQTYESIKDDLNISSLNYDYLSQDNTVVNEVGQQKIKALNRKPLSDINARLAKEKIEVYFSKTSRESNIITQVYEKNDSTNENNSLNKLEIVDVGEFIDETDIFRKRKRVFYIGKVFEDSNKTATFINLFTVIWD